MTNHEKKKIVDGALKRSNKMITELKGTLNGEGPVHCPIKMNRFKEFEEISRGLVHGVYMIAADTNIGKTSFMTSLAVDILENNPDAVLAYYSLDDDAREVGTRFITSAGQLPIEQTLVIDFKEDVTKAKFAEEVRKIERFISEGRLFILDMETVWSLCRDERIEQPYLNNFLRLLRELHPSLGGRKLVTMVDNFGNLSAMNPADMNDSSGLLTLKLQDVAKELRIPIICTIESSEKDGKPGQPRGSRRNLYASRMAFNLRRAKDSETSGFEDQLSDASEELLFLDVLKNKATGRRFAKLPLAMHQESGQTRTLNPEPEI